MDVKRNRDPNGEKDKDSAFYAVKGMIPDLVGIIVFTLVFSLFLRYIEFRLGIAM